MELLGFSYAFEPGTSPDGPALLLLHGTGGDERSLIGLGRDLLPAANLISPRGQVAEHGMNRFFRRLAEGVFDQEDLLARTGELHDFVDAARQEHALAGPVIAVGYSNGANIAASLLLRFPGTLDGAVLFRAMLPFEPEETKPLPGTSILLASGTDDSIIPHGPADALAKALEEAGGGVTHAWQPAGHELRREDIELAAAFLARNFLPDPMI